MADRRRGYWRLVFKTAWELSKEQFAWSYPLVFGLVVFGIQVVVNGWDQAVRDVVPTLIAAGAAALVAVAIYCINVLRAASGIYAEQLSSVERIERERDTAIAQRDSKPAESDASRGLALRIQQLEAQVAGAERIGAERIRREDWQKLAADFRALPGFEVAASWQKTILLGESWEYLRGGPKDTKECETLCRQAGTMLLKSPRVSQQLSGAVHSQTDPAWRWYEYLKETTGGLSDFGDGVGIKDGVEVETIVWGSLNELKARSARACVECATLEM
jgi:hypothetical protein